MVGVRAVSLSSRSPNRVHYIPVIRFPIILYSLFCLICLLLLLLLLLLLFRRNQGVSEYDKERHRELETQNTDSHSTIIVHKPGPKVINLFSCATQLSTKFILLINVKMPTIVGILTFISRINTPPKSLIVS